MHIKRNEFREGIVAQQRQQIFVNNRQKNLKLNLSPKASNDFLISQDLSKESFGKQKKSKPKQNTLNKDEILVHQGMSLGKNQAIIVDITLEREVRYLANLANLANLENLKNLGNLKNLKKDSNKIQKHINKETTIMRAEKVLKRKIKRIERSVAHPEYINFKIPLSDKDSIKTEKCKQLKETHEKGCTQEIKKETIEELRDKVQYQEQQHDVFSQLQTGSDLNNVNEMTNKDLDNLITDFDSFKIIN